MKQSPENPVLVADDGMYRLYGIPVTLRALKEAGIRLYSLGVLCGTGVPPDQEGYFRLVFGEVSDEESTEPYWSVEVRSQEGESWLACERGDDLNYVRIRKLLESRLPRQRGDRGKGSP